MVVSLLCVVASALTAFMGALMDIIRRIYSVEDLGSWNIVFYIMAGILALVAVIEFIRSIIIFHRRRQRYKDEDDLFDIQIKHTTLNGAYSGGNGKKKDKSAGKTGKMPRK